MQSFAGTTVTYSDIQDGPWCALPNICVDPLFRNPVTGNLGLRTCSPAIDVANDALMAADATDVDDDPFTVVPFPWDIEKDDRVRHFHAVDPNGDGWWVDMGAFEECNCLGDTDGNNVVELQDLSNLLGCFGQTPCLPGCCWADIDCDTDVDTQDLAFLLAHFGEACCPSGFTDGSGGESAQSDDAEAEALFNWLQSQSVEELLEWYRAGMPRRW